MELAYINGKLPKTPGRDSITRTCLDQLRELLVKSWKLFTGMCNLLYSANLPSTAVSLRNAIKREFASTLSSQNLQTNQFR